MQDTDTVRAAFTDPEEFWSSPLYRSLSATVAADPFLVDLAASARAGQVSTFAFFGAVQAVLLDGARHSLGDYYPSVVGAAAQPLDAQAGPALTAFAHEHADRLRDILRTRLVQTNHPQRAVGLRIALAAIAPVTVGAPVHLLEIGSSAGLVLRHAAYGYQLGGGRFGDLRSSVQLSSEWRSEEAAPDLDAIPSIASTTGIDLNPLDPRSEADRRWLRALVWPEDTGKAQLLSDALELAARTPLVTLVGDAIELCSRWSAGLPDGQPRVVFHCATRMHVPLEHRAQFDAAIQSIGADGPLHHAQIEGDGLVITGPDGANIATFDVDGHLAWARPR